MSAEGVGIMGSIARRWGGLRTRSGSSLVGHRQLVVVVAALVVALAAGPVAGAEAAPRTQGTAPGAVASSGGPAPYGCTLDGGSTVVVDVAGSADAPASATSGSVVALSDVTVSVGLTLSGGIMLDSATGSLGPSGTLVMPFPPSIFIQPWTWASGTGSATVTGTPGDTVPITLETFTISTNVGTIFCEPVGAPVALATVEIVPDTVTYVARYSGHQCDAVEGFAAGLGITPEEMIRLGVNGFRALAEAGQATPGTGVAPNEGDCEFAVTWPADEAQAIADAAAAWGVDEGQLHRGGGWLVVVLIYRAILGLG